MTDDKRKAWEEEVRWATWYVPATESKCSFDPPLRRNAKAILAADAEIKRLREAIEWACENAPAGENAYVAGIRRRAKE